MAAAESRLQKRRRGDAKTVPPQSHHGSAARAGGLQHKPITAAARAACERRRGYVKLALRNPITGCWAHSCGGISDCAIAVAKSNLDQGNPKPGKVEVWVVRGGGSA